MNPKDPRITEYQNDLKEYEPWGKLFLIDSFGRYFYPNKPCNILMIHNGLEYCKAQLKLNTITDTLHSDEEIKQRLVQIDEDIHKAEEVLLHDLSFRSLLLP